MDKVVLQIQAMSSKEEDLKSLRTFLAKNEENIMKAGSSVDDALSVLDPGACGLGYTYLLYAKASLSRIGEPGRFLQQCARYLSEATKDQILMTPVKFGKIARRFAEVAVEQKQPQRAIKPLRDAIPKMRTSSDQITPIHPDFIQACLCAKNYKAALVILEDDLYDIDPAGTGIVPRDVLRYYYYGGMIYTGLKDFKKAQEFFRSAWTTPAVSLSAIMAEAYKKYILVSLLLQGSVPPLSKSVSSLMARHLKGTSIAYNDLAHAYGSGSTEELSKVITTAAEVFTKDKNFGLVKQVMQSLYKRNIQRSTTTYLTISLKDISSTQSPKDAEKKILRMIDSGELNACINQEANMVSFQEDPERYDTTRTTRLLDSNIHKVMSLANRMKRNDEMISLSHQYIQRTSLAFERGRGDDDYEIGMEKIPGMNF